MISDLARRSHAVLTRALEFEGREREEFIAAQCAGDPLLRKHVDRLIAAAGSTRTFLETPALRTGGAAQPPPQAASPKQIGAFEIIGRLGAGGFGIVYHGRQNDPVEREVAIKLLRRGFDDPTVRARFLDEQRALARMQHPNIARLLEVGADAERVPYVAMELVRGDSITEYCNRRNLGIRDRLSLFLDVCRAVHHAHQQAIIHCDLKPSNILVTNVDGRPTPKIIDFGIARRVMTDVEKQSTSQTSNPIGTPRYMSPEQYQSDAIANIRFDVFALGVVLCEMLTGMTPYETTAPSQSSSSTAATPPSDLATRLPDSKTLASRLRGDLDAIVLKAVAWSAEQRYESASALADDVRRHLFDEPVAAVPATRRYRAVKFLKRHRLAAIAGAISAFAIVTGAAASLIGWKFAVAGRDAAQLAEGKARTSEGLARKAESDALHEALRSQRMLDFLLDDVITAAEPEVAMGADLRLVDVLDKAIPFAEARFANDRPTLIKILTRIGRAYSSIAQTVPAERAQRKALQLAEATGDFDTQSQLAMKLDLANTLYQAGQNTEARTLRDFVENTSNELLGRNHPITIQARMITLRGLPANAVKEAELRGIIAALEQQGLQDSDIYLFSMNSLAEVAILLARSDAVEISAQASELTKRRYLPLHPENLFARQLEAKALSNALQHERACDLMDALLKDATSVYGNSSAHMSGYRHVAIETYVNAKRPAKALRIAEEMVAEVESEFGRDSVPYSTATQYLGKALYASGRVAEAAAVLEDCWEARSRQWGPASPQAVGPGIEFARALIALGQPTRAIEILQEFRTNTAITPNSKAIAELLLATALEALGQSPEAAEIVAQVSERVEAAWLEGIPWSRSAMRRIAEFHRACGNLSEADRYDVLSNTDGRQ